RQARRGGQRRGARAPRRSALRQGGADRRRDPQGLDLDDPAPPQRRLQPGGEDGRDDGGGGRDRPGSRHRAPRGADLGGVSRGGVRGVLAPVISAEGDRARGRPRRPEERPGAPASPSAGHDRCARPAGVAPIHRPLTMPPVNPLRRRGVRRAAMETISAVLLSLGILSSTLSDAPAEPTIAAPAATTTKAASSPGKEEAPPKKGSASAVLAAVQSFYDGTADLQS